MELQPSHPAGAGDATCGTDLPPRVGKWTDTEIGRFWKYLSSKEEAYSEYFSRHMGEGLVRFASSSGLLHGEILDYGCGPGFLAERLLDQGLSVTGLDFSSSAVAAVSAKFAERPGWKGAYTAASLPSPAPSAEYDFIFCIETVEHLNDAWLNSTLEELHRLCKPGGAVMITTPFQESLTKNFVLCPFCNTEFHKVQHMRSLDAATLRTMLESHGFSVPFSDGISFWRFQHPFAIGNWQHWSVASLRTAVRHGICRFQDRLRPPQPLKGCLFKFLIQPGPHLCAIGVKAAADAPGQ